VRSGGRYDAADADRTLSPAVAPDHPLRPMTRRTVFRGGHVFDGTGSQPERADVTVVDGRIVDIGPNLDADDAIDVTGATLLPGLFDCHTHVMVSHIDLWKLAQQPFSYAWYVAIGNLRATLHAGITTARDAGGADLGVKLALEDGLIEGPRLHISLGMLSQTGGHGDTWYPSGTELCDALSIPHPGRPRTVVDGPDEMRRAVRLLVRAGADVIKVATSGGVLSPRDKPTHAHFRDDELAVLVAEADAAGISVMAHAQAAPGIKAALRAGIRSIEHGIYLDDEGIALMLDRGAWLVPTLVAPRGVIDAAAAGAAIPETSLQKAMDTIDIHRESFRRAVGAGVRIAMGTDSGVTPHGENLRELGLMVDGGMSPAAALEAATRSAARLLGVDGDRGTIEPGKRADLIVVDGDALDFSTLRERIRTVYLDGRQVAGTA
jgi:imidazolonepropionase-like amidohydrolase